MKNFWTDLVSEYAAKKGIKLDVNTYYWKRQKRYQCTIFTDTCSACEYGLTIDEAMANAAEALFKRM